MTGQKCARCACVSSVPCAIAGRAGRARRAECNARKVERVPGTRVAHERSLLAVMPDCCTPSFLERTAIIGW